MSTRGTLLECLLLRNWRGDEEGERGEGEERREERGKTEQDGVTGRDRSGMNHCRKEGERERGRVCKSVHHTYVSQESIMC